MDRVRLSSGLVVLVNGKPGLMDERHWNPDPKPRRDGCAPLSRATFTATRLDSVRK